MPTIRLNDCDYYYEIHGNGPETIVFSHGLLWSGQLFHKQVDYFKDRYQILIYDHRGQGKSEVTKKDYDIEDLYQDTLSLIQALEIQPVHFVGLSMGGMIGMRLAARNPDMLKSLILMDTSAEGESRKLKYNVLILLVKLFGLKCVTKPVMALMFGQNFLHDDSRRDEYEYWVKQFHRNDKSILKAVKAILNRKTVESELQNIHCPTLIMVGSQDVPTPLDKAKLIHEHISNSVMHIIKKAGHSSCVEEPEQCNTVIEQFLKGLSGHANRDWF